MEREASLNEQRPQEYPPASSLLSYRVCFSQVFRASIFVVKLTAPSV